MTELTTANQTAAAASPYRRALFVTVTFSDYTMRVWTGLGPRAIGSDTYTGAGYLGSVSLVPDMTVDMAGGVVASRVELTLSGIDASLAADMQDYEQQGAAVSILLGHLDVNDVLVDDPVSLWDGQVDTMAMTLGATLTVKLVCENFLAWLFRGPDGSRRTNEDQQDKFTGDLGLEFVGKLADAIPWGVSGNTAGETRAARGTAVRTLQTTVLSG